MFQKYKSYLDYIPIAIIALLFITETELETHAVNMSCQLCTTIIAVVVFYTICFNFKNAKNIALAVAITIWIVLVYAKNNYILPPRKF